VGQRSGRAVLAVGMTISIGAAFATALLSTVWFCAVLYARGQLMLARIGMPAKRVERMRRGSLVLAVVAAHVLTVVLRSGL
jgi:hypothetical protein